MRHLILVGTVSPVAFFAYPDKPSLLAPSACQIHSLAGPADDLLVALEWLADELGVSGVVPKLQAAQRPGLVSGALTVESIGSAIGHLLPENAIICDESVTSGRGLHPFTRGCAPHDWLSGTGGAIGRGLPEATGAAVACPDRPVLCLSGDGSAMYTLQALWTQARENLDVTTVIFSTVLTRSSTESCGMLEQLRAPKPTTCSISTVRTWTGPRLPRAWAWKRCG